MTGTPDIRVTPIGYVHSSRRDVDGTPVVDIKPVMSEFLPRGDVRKPRWSTELMRHYWRAHD